MASIGSTVKTLSDWAKEIDPEGKVAATVELLSQTNEILDDMLWKEGNLPTGERTTIRTGLPTVYWRLLNQGTPNSKATSAQVDEQCGILTARSQLDVDLAELNGNTNEYRLSEGTAFLEAMSQESASTLFYGSAANPEEYVGFANRYGDLSAGNAQNIISAGSVSGGDGSSIYLVGWGERTVHGVFPKGSQAGIQHTDLGMGDAFDSSNNRFRAYMDEWKWKQGLVVKDWRYVVRIANIDVSALIADNDGSSINVIELMLKAIHRLPSMANCRPVFYANRTIREMLDVQAMNKSNLLLNVGEEEGKMKTTLRGIPIKTVDALLETEATVS